MNCSLTHMHNSTEGNLLLWKGAIMQCLGICQLVFENFQKTCSSLAHKTMLSF